MGTLSVVLAMATAYVLWGILERVAGGAP